VRTDSWLGLAGCESQQTPKDQSWTHTCGSWPRASILVASAARSASSRPRRDEQILLDRGTHPPRTTSTSRAPSAGLSTPASVPVRSRPGWLRDR